MGARLFFWLSGGRPDKVYGVGIAAPHRKQLVVSSLTETGADMTNSYRMTRRQFVHSAAAAGAALMPAGLIAASPQPGQAATATSKTSPPMREKVHGVVEPFPLSQVRLRKGPFQDAQEADRRYLHLLASDRLLHTFRLTAGLPSTAEPLGGWEKPDTDMRGPFLGHYLSACALMYAATGDADLK